MVFPSPMQWLSRLRFIGTVLGCGFLYSVTMFAETPPADGAMLVYFGTYTGAKSKGIYVSRFDPATGRLYVVAADVDPAAPVPPNKNGRMARRKLLPGTVKLLFLDPN